MSCFSTSKTVTARKSHICRSCETSIDPGQAYTRVNGFYEGEWYRYAAHPECIAVETEMNYDNGTAYGEWETLGDYLRNEGHFPDQLPHVPNHVYETVLDRLGPLANRLGIEVPR